MTKLGDKGMSDNDVWNLIYEEAEILYTEYLDISTFDDFIEMAKVVEPEPTQIPNYDVPMTIQWGIAPQE